MASKVTAMIGRGLPRDFIDVAAAQARYDRGQLLRLAFHRDPGLRVVDVARAMQLLDRLPDEPFTDYQLTTDDVRQVRDALQDWPRDAEQDQAGQDAHDQAHRGQGRPVPGTPPTPDDRGTAPCGDSRLSSWLRWQNRFRRSSAPTHAARRLVDQQQIDTDQHSCAHQQHDADNQHTVLVPAFPQQGVADQPDTDGCVDERHDQGGA